MTENTAPTVAEFSFDDWFGDVRLPERSADVFTRADLVGTLEALQRRIEEEGAADTALAEASLGDDDASEVAALVEEYTTVLEQFLASKVTLFMRAVPSEEQRAIRDSYGPQLPKSASDKSKLERMRLVGAGTLAASAVGISRADGPRQPASFTDEQIIQLEDKLGAAQMGKVNAAFTQACNELPTVSADFLPKSSGQASTQP